MGKKIILIPTPPDFDFGECLWYLNRNFDDCMYQVGKAELNKLLDINGKLVLVNIKALMNQLQVSVSEGLLTEDEEGFLVGYIENWFDIRLDLSPFYQLLEQDERLAYMATEFRGLRLVGIPELFEAICWAIIGQQINLTFAYQLKRRLVEKYGRRIEIEGGVYYLFPEPAVLTGVSVADLQEMQFSRSKANYLLIVAAAFADQLVGKAQLIAMADLQIRQQALTALKGIGIWTANYVLMKSLKERSCIPFGDAGLLNAMLKHKIISDKQQTQQIKDFFADYKGWESYLVFYFWRSLSVKATS